MFSCISFVDFRRQKQINTTVKSSRDASVLYQKSHMNTITDTTCEL